MIHLKDFWRTIRRTLTVFILGTTVAVFTCQAINPPFVIKHLGDGQSIVQIDGRLCGLWSADAGCLI